MSSSDLFEALVDSNAEPTIFERQMSLELIFLIREIFEARTGYLDTIDRINEAQQYLTKALATYREWLGRPLSDTAIAASSVS